MAATKATIAVDGMELPQLTHEPASWAGSSLLSATQITSGGLQMLLTQAQQMRHLVMVQQGKMVVSDCGDGSGNVGERDDNDRDRLKHKIVATVFFEASTRTACSFQAAALRLGGTFLHVDGCAGSGNSSAASKGESLADTVRCLEAYADVTVLRHPVTGSVAQVIQMAQKPVLNAGDGVGEHPTQALLDVYTMYDELHLAKDATASASAASTANTRLGPLTVVMLGDLKHGRTVHSLAKLLCVTQHVLWEGTLTLRFCAPEGLQVPDGILDFCTNYNDNNDNSPGVIQVETFQDPAVACVGAHVLYVTRIQRERFDSDEAYSRVKVGVTLQYMRKDASAAAAEC